MAQRLAAQRADFPYRLLSGDGWRKANDNYAWHDLFCAGQFRLALHLLVQQVFGLVQHFLRFDACQGQALAPLREQFFGSLFIRCWHGWHRRAGSGIAPACFSFWRPGAWWRPRKRAMLPPMLDHFLQRCLLWWWGGQAAPSEFTGWNWAVANILALFAQLAQARQALILRGKRRPRWLRRRGWRLARPGWLREPVRSGGVITALVYRCVEWEIVWFLVHSSQETGTRETSYPRTAITCDGVFIFILLFTL